MNARFSAVARIAIAITLGAGAVAVVPQAGVLGRR